MLNVSPLKCLIKYIATFLGSFNCPLIDIRKSDIDTLYFVQITAIILSVSGAKNRDSGTSICFFLTS